MRDAPRDSGPRVRRRLSLDRSWRDWATAGLPVLACFLGGATEKWAEGIVVALFGLLLLLNPPRFSLGPVANGILLAVLACAAVAFLPADWFFQPAWRQALANDFGIKLASVVSPQPWVTAGCSVSFFAGLAWLYYVAAQEIENRSERQQLRLFAGGIILLAGVAIALHYAQTSLPFWHNERGFGPFPNRNQTANILGLTAIVILACGQDDIRQGKKRWLLWLAGLALVITAIVLNFSRAGLALLLVGTALWLAALTLLRGSTARIAIAISALLVLLTVVLLFGGQTLERFHLRPGSGPGFAADFRWLIFQDTFQLLRASPWCGLGLGNFEQVFAIFRDASLEQTRVLHPESDWLWALAELGWPALFLILAALAILLPRVFPFREGTNQRFRMAAFIAAILFAMHGLVDVSGHRVGTAFAGLFLFGTAINRPLPRRASAILTNTFRFAGLILFAVGVAWIVAAYREMPLPGSVGADLEKRLAKRANAGKLYNETISRATRGLEWAPLDWQLYFLRALGKVGAKRPSAEALDDFRRARFLEPNSFEVPYQEGTAWLTTQPLLAITAWREALRRAGSQRPELYARMLTSAAMANPVVSRMLEDFGSAQHDLALAYLERVEGERFTSALRRLLEHDSSLQAFTREERGKLFALWTKRGDLTQLTVFAEAHPEFLGLAWRGVAQHHATRHDFRVAYELAKRFGEPPILPQAAPGSSIEELQKTVYSTTNNYGAGFALYTEQMRAGKTDDALRTVRRFTSTAGSPSYFYSLEAEGWAALHNWERAWQAWQSFEAIPR